MSWSLSAPSLSDWLELHLRALEEDERLAQQKLKWATLARTDAEEAVDALGALVEAAGSADPHLRRQLVPLALACLRTAMPYLADTEALADAGLTPEQIEQVNQMRSEAETEALESQQPGAQPPEQRPLRGYGVVVDPSPSSPSLREPASDGM